MKNLFLSYSSSACIALVLLLSACAKRPSTSFQALTYAQEAYDALNTNYSKLMSLNPASSEAMQELRVLGVKRERTWAEFFFFGCNRSLPILRIEGFLKTDLDDIDELLFRLRNFNLEKHPVYTHLAIIHQKLQALVEQLHIQKEYLDEKNTYFTQEMVSSVNRQMLFKDLK